VQKRVAGFQTLGNKK